MTLAAGSIHVLIGLKLVVVGSKHVVNGLKHALFGCRGPSDVLLNAGDRPYLRGQA
jgi:hypothetical protein